MGARKIVLASLSVGPLTGRPNSLAIGGNACSGRSVTMPILPHVYEGGAPQQDASAMPELNVEVDPSIPITIRNVRAGVSLDGRLDGLSYEIQNRSAASLVAWQIRWDIFAGTSSPGAAFSEFNTVDLWYGKPDGLLKPGDVKEERIGVKVSAAAPVSKIVAVLIYAEFTDGTRQGVGADVVSRSLQANHLSLLNKYQQALNEYKQGGEAGLAAWFKQRCMEKDRTACPSQAYLANIYRTGGIVRVMGEIHRKLP
jgi:hypothetical protein